MSVSTPESAKHTPKPQHPTPSSSDPPIVLSRQETAGVPEGTELGWPGSSATPIAQPDRARVRPTQSLLFLRATPARQIRVTSDLSDRPPMRDRTLFARTRPARVR